MIHGATHDAWQRLTWGVELFTLLEGPPELVRRSPLQNEPELMLAAVEDVQELFLDLESLRSRPTPQAEAPAGDLLDWLRAVRRHRSLLDQGAAEEVLDANAASCAAGYAALNGDETKLAAVRRAYEKMCS